MAEADTDGETEAVEATLGEAVALGVWVAEMVTLRDSADVLALGDGERVAEADTDGEAATLGVRVAEMVTLRDSAEVLALGDGEREVEAVSASEALVETDGDAKGDADGVGVCPIQSELALTPVGVPRKHEDSGEHARGPVLVDGQKFHAVQPLVQQQASAQAA